MINNMATSLFAHGSIRTTQAKAKELRGVADHLITFAKRGDLHARRQVLRRIRNKVVVSRLFDEIAPTFAERNGGYTRVLRLAPRRGDSVEICLVELVGDELRSDYASRASSRGDSGAAPPEVEVGDGSESAADAEDSVEEDAAELEAESAGESEEDAKGQDPDGAAEQEEQEDSEAPQESDEKKG